MKSYIKLLDDHSSLVEYKAGYYMRPHDLLVHRLEVPPPIYLRTASSTVRSNLKIKIDVFFEFAI